MMSGLEIFRQKSVLGRQSLSPEGRTGKQILLFVEKAIPLAPHLSKVRPQSRCSVAQEAVCVLSELAEVECKAL